MSLLRGLRVLCEGTRGAGPNTSTVASAYCYDPSGKLRGKALPPESKETKNVDIIRVHAFRRSVAGIKLR